MAKAKATIIDASAYDYKKTRVLGADGKVKHSLSNDDAVARAMTVLVAGAKDVSAALAKVVKVNKMDPKFDPAKRDNLGLARMAIGNSLRGMVRNDQHVTIGDIVVKSLEQRVAVPEAKPSAAPAKKAKAPKKAKAKKARAKKRSPQVDAERAEVGV